MDRLARPRLGAERIQAKHWQVPPPRAIGPAAVPRRGSLSKARTGWQVLKDSLPEWSKGVDSSSTSASCVGSNPTAVMCKSKIQRAELPQTAAHRRELVVHARGRACVNTMTRRFWAYFENRRARTRIETAGKSIRGKLPARTWRCEGPEPPACSFLRAPSKLWPFLSSFLSCKQLSGKTRKAESLEIAPAHAGHLSFTRVGDA